MRTESAHQRLRELILDGGYPPGSRLTELDVAAALEVSRTPVREAFRSLAADGLVVAAGRGVRVVELDAGELAHCYRVRAALEGLTGELAAARQRAGRLAPAELTDLERLADRTHEATAAGRLTEAVRLNRAFHRRVAELAANPVALHSLDRLWDRIQVSTRTSLRVPGRTDLVDAQHRALLTAIAAGDPVAAAEAARRHVLDTCTIHSSTDADETE
ncbi:GntR family transcriptional regulator [Kitasatospora paracochleata]|uniref:DNA-binding GntR family transcriptional regulator n=1 Tax=Kitasatospora paracochleata TaxID=58354 RepID=A0ABT1IT65_9ACTN|nr:GntR family transcriptional regulator [Kitasatospora paracochleata]MCP2308101.1 DNA-binding GntR family transcriptional regulator [Kitasatospora paracochleata]